MRLTPTMSSAQATPILQHAGRSAATGTTATSSPSLTPRVFPFTITACSSAAVILSTSVTTAGQRPKSALRRAARTLRERWENILEVSFDVEEEISCKLLCSLNPSCVVYTHYNASHPTFLNSCFMMRDLNGPFKSCESCKTGCLDCGAKTTTTTTWDTT